MQEFSNFVNRIIENSRLEINGGRLSKAFLAEASRKNEQLMKFKDDFRPIWDKWKKDQGKHLISPFIEAHGNIIFRKWLTEIFPFQYYSLRLSCKRGPSSVDAVMLLNYFYSPEELEIIESKIKQYSLDFPIEEVCRMLLTNAMKSIPQTISDIMEIDYRIMVEKIKNYKRTKQGFQIMIRAVGRIG
ncbi:MAG: hypothetical protein EU549_02670 [Promethearchaeota archaeon]|nr:MAG: hypothetical protein EU549_02670 [Candidatus Lokiarchaeota archaeon]